MNTFLFSPPARWSLLLTALFLTLIFSLCLLVTVFSDHCRRRTRWLNVSAFLALILLLTFLTDAFERINLGLSSTGWLPPMGLLWCVAIGMDLLVLWELREIRRIRSRTLSRDSVKEAMDRLPSGICYFTMRGAVKLCNLQMDRLFRVMAQKDLQNITEFREALDGCGPDTGVICLSRELQNYLFPDGRVWHCRQSLVRDREGTPHTEVVFSEFTELYHRELELKRQTRKLQAISRELKRLSDNAVTLTREKEVLSAKTKLHDQMGTGLTAVRQQLLGQGAADGESAVRLLRQAVSALRDRSEYPPEEDVLAGFIQDAGALSVRVHLTGELPENGEHAFVFLLAMRECLSNGVRHAGATELWVQLRREDGAASVHITNHGAPPAAEVVPKGGLHNLYRCTLDCGGTMELQSKPAFALTITFPRETEGTP